MCGIIGYIGHKNFDHNAIKMLMLWNSIDRGKDSTGIYTPKAGIVKSIQEAKIFINNEMMKIEPDTMFIGHVRAKSVGFVSCANTHPFESENIIACHNGTLTDKDEYAKFYGRSGSNYQVDSQLLTILLDITNNPIKLYYHCLGTIDGAASLLFFDKRYNSLNFFTNGERPLFYAKGKYGYYISSIKEPLNSVGCVNIEECKENILYTIYKNRETEIIETEIKKVSEYEDWKKEEKQKEINKNKKEREEQEKILGKTKKYFNCSPFTIKCSKTQTNLVEVKEISSKLNASNKAIRTDEIYTIHGKLTFKGIKFFLVSTDDLKNYETYCYVEESNFFSFTRSDHATKGNEITLIKEINKTKHITNVMSTLYIHKGRKMICISDILVDNMGNETIDAKILSYDSKYLEEEIISLKPSEFKCDNIIKIFPIDTFKNKNNYYLNPQKEEEKEKLTDEEILSKNMTTISSILNGMDNMTERIMTKYKELPSYIQTQIGDKLLNFDGKLTEAIEQVKEVKLIIEEESYDVKGYTGY